MVRQKNRVIYLHGGYIYHNSFQKSDIDADGVYRCYYYSHNEEEAEFLKNYCERLARETWGEVPQEYSSPVQPVNEFYRKNGVGTWWIQATSIYPPKLEGVEDMQACCDMHGMDIAIKPVPFEGKFKKAIVLNLVSVEKPQDVD